MQGSDWRARLEDAIEKSGRSKREISLAAGKGPGYVFSILSEGKDPTIDNLIKICGAINVSLTQILYGVEMSQETQEILSLIESNPNMRSGILQILREKDKA
jgi:ribonucleoside-diphosphate reductase alpha chain